MSLRTETALHTGDVVEVLRGVADNTFDAVLCDPPYGLSFMGKKWDYDVPSADLWREVLRVCKPGAPLIAFSGTRTYHRTVVQIEDAGFEIRDCIAWMYGSGFPKSLNVGKAVDAAAGAERPVIGSRVLTGSAAMSTAEKGGTYASNTSSAGRTKLVDVTGAATDLAKTWDGYGTALKPAFEPAVLARKPLEGTVAVNVAKWGVGALAIDASRVATDWSERPESWKRSGHSAKPDVDKIAAPAGAGINCHAAGRWPANVILDEDAASALDAQTGEWRSNPGGSRYGIGFKADVTCEKTKTVSHSDTGGASRFLYCAKASREERELGCLDLPRRTAAEVTGSHEGAARLDSPRTGAGRTSGARNHHPTVKPVTLTRYLARLIMPPKPGAILVPFAGSGSEMVGAVLEGWPSVVGIEREAEYVTIARARLALAASNPRAFEAEAERAAKADARQLDMFGRTGT